MNRLMGLALVVVCGLAASGCAPPSLRHVGYTGNKVWYHWVVSAEEHTIIVCDIQPDGSETNCQESNI